MDRAAVLTALAAVLSPSTMRAAANATTEQLRHTLQAARDQIADYETMGFEDMATR
jgi:type II secretory pathway pseudopilin PulG